MRSVCLRLCGLLFGLSIGRGEMIGPQTVPTGRLLETARSAVRRNPLDPDARYALGRIRYAEMCARDPRAVEMYSEKPPFRFPSEHPIAWQVSADRLPAGKPVLEAARDAIRQLKSAVALDKGREPGLYALTLACVYEAASPFAEKVDRRATKAGYLAEAYRYYRLSYDASQKRDLEKPYAQQPMTYESWISVEAATALLRLQPKRDRVEIEGHLKEMKAKPGGPITPIIFDLSGPRSLDDLLDPARTVRFDLDGTHRPQSYPWVSRNTCFLVWQPDPLVRITSGRQLFGSATWWMMYRDGYAAMAALDEDGNGWLEGDELRGLAVWQDRNGDGVEEPGEVVAIAHAGIAALATRATGSVGSSFFSAFGLRTMDGRQLPTYDWVVAPMVR